MFRGCKGLMSDAECQCDCTRGGGGGEQEMRRGGPQGHGSHPDMLVKQLFSSWR